MMVITIKDRLPFVSVIVRANGKSVTIDRVLLDTGSAATAFDTELMSAIDIKPELTDKTARMVGIGEGEYAVRKRVDAVELNGLIVAPTIVQLAGLDYGYGVNGILGLDFMLKTQAVIDFTKLEVRKGMP